jgi:hypothetical protein
LALIGVIALVASVAFGGRRYFYCPQMSEASFHACCARGLGDGAAIDRESCCSARQLDAPDPGFVVLSPPVVQAPLVAVLPVPAGTCAPSMSSVRRFAHDARAGPPPSDAREHRLRLMVFLT